MKTALSPQQQQIVEAPDGPYLVVAAAGSGKTRILTSRIRYLLLDRGIRSRVLALTFTNKAAAEMRERLSDVPELGERAYIGTIHSFCQALLEAYGNLIGFDQPPAILERENDRLALLEEVFENNPALKEQLMRYQDPKKRRGYLYRMLGQISTWKREWDTYAALCEGDWPSRPELMMFRDYEERLALQGAIEFDDILLLAYRILSERPKVARIYQRSYRYFCVDEAQDLNAVQYGIIHLLASDSKNLLMVGDPNQAIYGFNGSSTRYMCECFVNDFSATQIELRENYRSSRAVIRAANAIYPGSINLENVKLPGSLEISACENEAEEAAWIADNIQALLQGREIEGIDGPLAHRHFAILARNRYIFEPLERTLTERELPYHVRQPAGGGLESDWGRVFDLGLRILGNPENTLYLRELHKRLKLPKARRIDTAGNALQSLDSCLDGLSGAWRQDYPHLLSAWKRLHEDVNRFHDTLTTLENALKESARESDDNVRREDLARAIGDVGHLRRLWENYTRQVSRESRSLNHFRNQLAMGALNPHTDGEGITLATVHAAKGLEYEIVFVMGLVEGGFPDYRAIREGTDALDEEKNDAFVAVTRSKRLLYLSWPHARFMPWDKENRVRQTRSRFLDLILENTAIREHDEAHVAEDP